MTPDHGMVPVCAIGASAGGVAALRQFFSAIDPNLNMAFVVIMHLDPRSQSNIAWIIGQVTEMPVQQVDDRVEILPDNVYVIAPDRSLRLDGNALVAAPFDLPHGHRKPINAFLLSMARQRNGGIAMILSGAGSDGAEGACAARDSGALVLVQEPSEAEFPIMPKSTIATGCVDVVGTVRVLAERIAAIAGTRIDVPIDSQTQADNDVKIVLSILRERSGHDFSEYKRSTVRRRVARRMQATGHGAIEAYEHYLRETPEEVQSLLAELLISVSSFFRDPDAFESLQRLAISPLFDALETGSPIRAWSVGCASGEEVYSLAILLVEEATSRGLSVPIQIFASDLDEGALARAREGRYPDSISRDLSDERLNRFFTREEGHFVVRKEIRDLILFAAHSAIKDPPFSRLDLVVCRNVLIYLDRELQSRLCQVFHYALKPGRYLFLGTAETIESMPELFEIMDRDARIFRTRRRPRSFLPTLMHTSTVPSPVETRFPAEPPPAQDSQAGELHAKALEEKAPPSLTVDLHGRILHLSHNAGRFLLPSGGTFKAELLAQIRPELRSELTHALHKAFEHAEGSLTAYEDVAFNGTRRKIGLHVAPVATADSTVTRVLVMFLDGGRVLSNGGDGAKSDPSAPEQQLQEEVRRLSMRLSESQQRQNEARERYFLANEQLQTMNEEYRSTCEELETSKEELQSINEELQTVNTELKAKLQTISMAHNDLRNLMAATDIGTLFLDMSLRIKLFTPKVSTIFNITETDIGRTITDFTHHLVYDRLEKDSHELLRTLIPIEREIETQDNRWLLMQLRPYRTLDERIDGLIMTFIDITERRTTTMQISSYAERLNLALEAGEIATVTWDVERDILREEGPIAKVLGLASADGDRTLGDLLSVVHADDRRRLEKRLRAAARTGEAVSLDFRTDHRSEDGDERWLRIEGAGSKNGDGPMLIAVIRNVSDSRKLAATQRRLLSELHGRLANTFDAIHLIARHTRASTADDANFAHAFEVRLETFGAVHRMLIERDTGHVPLSELVRVILETTAERASARLQLDGPAIEVAAHAAIPLALTIGELVINARDHGALSTPAGTVAMTWRIDKAEGDSDAPAIVISWQERGGPLDAPPGFDRTGARLIEEIVSRDFGGSIERVADADALACTIRLPLTGSKLRTVASGDET